ncbi:MAG: hypothetical protein QOE70_411 [Chthoniobacter sp.]|jgi:hypothetical protein|nr:hypothetical protein [Chthoniobacter sp.]
MANLAITPANIVPGANANPQRATAGVAIAAGDIVYKDTTGKLQLSDADGAAAAQAVQGMAVNSAGVGQPANFVTEDDDLDTGGAAVEGVPYFLSATAGKMCEEGDLATGMRSIFVGVGKADGKLNFKPVAGGSVRAVG